tara:strand:- start:1 stop:789 length:789 start_codon:yes stop_codon:yes gene_type:complete
MNKILSALCALVLSSVVMAATTDNEIFLEQVGDTLTLTIDQIGYGNKFGGTIVSGAVATDMLITGTSITFNLDQIGNSNQLFGPIDFNSGNIDMEFTGDSNIYDWAIGTSNLSADSLDLDLDVTGDSNTWDVDIAQAAASESLNYDLVLIGGTNVFNTDIDYGNTVWNWEITGDGNNIWTIQKEDNQSMIWEFSGDDADIDITQMDEDQIIVAEWDGDDADIDIIQKSGTCPSGVTSCSGIVNIEVDSEGATLTINQKDTGE